MLCILKRNFIQYVDNLEYTKTKVYVCVSLAEFLHYIAIHIVAANTIRASKDRSFRISMGRNSKPKKSKGPNNSPIWVVRPLEIIGI